MLLKEEILDQIKNQIKTIFDPEIPVDIYELGLIYNVKLLHNNKKVEVEMTLTSPNCPEAQSIPNNVRKAIEFLDLFDEVIVKIVWDPPWDRTKMSEVAKLALNL